MILTLALIACTPSTGPVDPGLPTPGTPGTPASTVKPPLSTLALDQNADAQGVQFSNQSEVGGWSLTLALDSYGRGQQRPVDTIEPTVDGNRTSYDRGDFVDWFEVGDRGTKHGIDVLERPSGNNPLRFEYTVLTDLNGMQDEHGIHFTDANGQVMFHYNDIVTYDADGASVPSWLELDCATDVLCRIRLVVDDTDATYPLQIDPLAFSNENVLTSPPGEPSSGLLYGVSVDVDGDFAVVGAPLADISGNNRGAAFIYQRLSGSTWTLTHTLEGDANNDQCGRSVAMAAGRVLVGCWTAEDTGDQTNRGLARVYLYDGTNWVLEDDLKGIDVANQRSGYSVDLNESGDRAIIGGWGTNSTLRAGSVTIFERSGFGPGSWSAVETITDADANATTNRFGFSVGISDAHAVVGAPRFNPSGTEFQGRAFFYDRVAVATWTQAAVVADGPTTNSRLGYSVATSDETAVLGVPNQVGGGEAQVWDFAGGTWSLTQALTQFNANNGDRFGHAVGINGNSIVVGAIRDDNATTDARDVGSSVVFDLVGTVPTSPWEEQVELLTRFETHNDDADQVRTGFDVGISNTWVIAGSNPRTIEDTVEVETAHLFELTECTAQLGQAGCDVDLLITEVHPDPRGGIDEQFIEIHNAGTSAVQLLGATIEVDAFTHVIDDSFVIDAGGYAVVTRTDDSSVNGGIAGIPGVYVNPSLVLDDTASTVQILGTDPADVLAEMSYSGFATPASSLQLSYNGSSYADPSNSYAATDAGNWCPTFLPYADGGGLTDFMSPRLANESCGVDIDFDYMYVIDDIGTPPAMGSTSITVLGNRFTTGNGGEGDVTYTAGSSGQIIVVQYDGTSTRLVSNVRGYDETCFDSFTADPSTTLDDGYSSGEFTNLVCTNP